MAKVLCNQLNIRNYTLCRKLFTIYKSGSRKILSAAYTCDDAWQKRLQTPILKNIKPDHYFVQVDKKFDTKELASGVDVDLFLNVAEEESLLGEIEHVLYRFRKTKRSTEIFDSTAYATIRTFLKNKDYEALFRILSDRMNYGIFPNFYGYNILMNTFLKENQYRDAAQIAVLMMQQESFQNALSCILGLYSCHMFVKEGSFEAWERNPKEPEVETEEEVYIRVPYLKNPSFDDHFEIVNPKHLIGKSFYLIGKEVKDILGRTCQLIGLGMYEKWEKASVLLDTLSSSSENSVFLEGGVESFKKMLLEIPDDEDKTREKWLSVFEPKFQLLEKNGKLLAGDLHEAFQKKLEEVPKLEEADIQAQKLLFEDWQKTREEALAKQEAELDRQRRIKIIEEKKNCLYWKEKILFFYENEEDILAELEEIEKIKQGVAQKKKKYEVEDEYEVPETILGKRPESPVLKVKKHKPLTFSSVI